MIVDILPDSRSFIFTLKNPHGVEPTRYMKKETLHCGKFVISSQIDFGPIFGKIDLYIKDSHCMIKNNGTSTYDCHPQYKESLYFGSKKELYGEYECDILDYEVFDIDYESKYTVDHVCKHSDIIWKYIETNDISEESLKQIDDDTELLTDFDAISCKDSNIRLKISRYYLKNPSEFLPDTRIVNKQYDHYVSEWTGDYKWKLLYRASEHDYTAKSFHDYCDDKGPTLIVIKSSGGWIFGGYTTQSWKATHYFVHEKCIYYNMK